MPRRRVRGCANRMPRNVPTNPYAASRPHMIPGRLNPEVALPISVLDISFAWFNA
jgi:hypothetical protein